MSVLIKRWIPMGLLSFLGFLMVVNYFTPVAWVGNVSREIQNWSAIIAAVTLGLAGYTLLRMHVPRTIRLNIYSAALVISLCVLPILYFITGSTTSFSYNWIYQTFVGRLDPSMYSLVAFSILSACFRAFRVRNLESLIVLTTAIVVLIGMVPIGGAVKPVVNWLLDVANTAGYRGVQLGIGIGLFAYALRLLLGIERAWLSELRER